MSGAVLRKAGEFHGFSGTGAALAADNVQSPKVEVNHERFWSG
jgi:hypothetical protein